jgi:hypothetical protein
MLTSAEWYRGAITSNELNRLTDLVKNEALLSQLCTQAAVECANPQMSGFFARLAEERAQMLDDATGALQKYAGPSR